MDRIAKLCTYLFACQTFADVGCDHGYCTQYMLKNNLCKKAVISDVSAKCLAKAQALLKEYEAQGRLISVCCDGLTDIPQDIDCALIAGMGGEEIVKILSQSFIPKTFVFQPMKNVKKLRQYLLNSGCAITQDTVFADGEKFYFVLVGKREGEQTPYTPRQLECGTDDVSCPDFALWLAAEIQKRQTYLQSDMNERSRQEIIEQLKLLQEVQRGEA